MAGLLVVAVLATVFTGVALYCLVREWRLRRIGVRTTATVVGMAEDRPGNGKLGLSPILEFVTDDGTIVRTNSPVHSSEPSALPGRRMTVYYHPRRPDRLAIVGYGLAVSWGFLLVGGLLFGLLLGLLTGGSEGMAPTFSNAVPLVLGPLLVGAGGFALGRVWLLRLRGVRTDGVVVGEYVHEDADRRPVYYPVVRFGLPDGQRIDAPVASARSRQRPNQGQAVRVCHHPKDPYRLMLTGNRAPWYGYVLALSGLLVSGSGLLDRLTG